MARSRCMTSLEPAAEVVVQPLVLRVQLVVDVGAGRVGRVHRVLLAAHGRGGGRHVRVGARRDRGVDGRAERGALAGGDDAERAPQHVRVDLHHERVLEQPAGHHELGDPAAGGRERVDDDPGAERGRFDQGPVDIGRPGGQGEAHDDAGQLNVDQHRAVPVEPVQGDQPVRAGRLAGGLRRQQLEQGDAALLRLVPVRGRDRVVEEPGEDVLIFPMTNRQKGLFRARTFARKLAARRAAAQQRAGRRRRGAATHRSRAGRSGSCLWCRYQTPKTSARPVPPAVEVRAGGQTWTNSMPASWQNTFQSAAW